MILILTYIAEYQKRCQGQTVNRWTESTQAGEISSIATNRQVGGIDHVEETMHFMLPKNGLGSIQYTSPFPQRTVYNQPASTSGVAYIVPADYF